MRKIKKSKCKNPCLSGRQENYNSKLKILKNFGFWFVILIFDFCILNFLLSNSYAEEITILYTGDTHAMIYPCSCPIEPDGGVARRSTLIKQIREKNPHTLLLDSGAFFAGGLLDEYTQNTSLDMERTKINLKAMALMKYDAVAISEDEFNFGKEFFRDNIDRTGLAFLSCNVKAPKLLPYIIKDLAGIKIGIIGVTSPVASPKAGGLKLTEPKEAVSQAVSYLRKTGVNIIVLLSHLGESEGMNLINDIPGIDILIIGHPRAKDEPPFTKVASTLVLVPSWEARRLNKLSLIVEDNKIKDYKVEELRLSDQIAEDQNIFAILPRCFSDANCKKEGSIGTCLSLGSVNSNCTFYKANKISLSLILSRDCATCNPEGPLGFFKRQFPGLEVSYLYYPEAKAVGLLKDYAITSLPAYLLGKEIEKEKGFDSTRGILEQKGDFYILRPQFAGQTYLFNREKIKGRLDLFLSLYDKNSRELLDVTKEFNPAIHFLVVASDGGSFEAASGAPEVEESLRAMCVQKHFPASFWDYISCRTQSKNSSWWEDCAERLDVNKIKTCARDSEGALLLEGNISLNKELKIMFGPTYLVDNQEIFSSQGVPVKEELRKIIKK